MQRVQTLARWLLPFPVTILTLFKFGSQRRLVLLWACETLLPVSGPFPQIWHTLAMFNSPSISSRLAVIRIRNRETIALATEGTSFQKQFFYFLFYRMARYFWPFLPPGCPSAMVSPVVNGAKSIVGGERSQLDRPQIEDREMPHFGEHIALLLPLSECTVCESPWFGKGILRRQASPLGDTGHRYAFPPFAFGSGRHAIQGLLFPLFRCILRRHMVAKESCA
jgi:hypothetical protein